VIGTCRPEQVRRNSGVRAGDALILTKSVGVGIYSAAIKKDALSPDAYREMIDTTTLLNKVGSELAADKEVHAITDVTGFGVLGHGLEMARGSKLVLRIKADQVPLLKDAAHLAQKDHVTGASHRNWASYGGDIVLPAGFPDWRRHLLSDPQTSGGLLVAVAPERAQDLLQTIIASGCPAARIIGHAEAGKPSVTIE
jgi:selenide,water dikinase